MSQEIEKINFYKIWSKVSKDDKIKNALIEDSNDLDEEDLENLFENVPNIFEFVNQHYGRDIEEQNLVRFYNFMKNEILEVKQKLEINEDDNDV